jgi:hypothetical protein
MTIYGPGGSRLSAPRNLRTPDEAAVAPRDWKGRKSQRSDLKIKPSSGHTTTVFSQLRELKPGDNVEDVVSAEHFRAHEHADTDNNERAHSIEEKSVGDFIKVAPTSCDRCRELIPGNAARNVVITVTLPSVGAAAVDCKPTTICQACAGTQAEAAPAAVNGDYWKRNLKPRQLEIWNRVHEGGEKQQAIADDLGINQSDVSKILKACERVRDAYLAGRNNME